MRIEDISERINAFLVSDFEVEQEALVPTARLKEALDLDSLDFIDLVVAIEREFGFKVNPEDFQSMVTLADFYHYVWGRLERGAKV